MTNDGKGLQCWNPKPFSILAEFYAIILIFLFFLMITLESGGDILNPKFWASLEGSVLKAFGGLLLFLYLGIQSVKNLQILLKERQPYKIAFFDDSIVIYTFDDIWMRSSSSSLNWSEVIGIDLSLVSGGETQRSFRTVKMIIKTQAKNIEMNFQTVTADKVDEIRLIETAAKREQIE